MKRVCLKHGLSLVALLGVLLWSSGCATAPETGRRQMILLSASEEMQLGLTEFEKLKQDVPVSKDQAAKAMVERVGRRIAAVAPLPNAQWEFVLFQSDEANAFCLPGGKVGVYTGILPVTKAEAGLATVIGHEVAHATARHGAERMSSAMVLQTGGQLASSALGGENGKYSETVGAAYGIGSQVLVALPHSRTQESEADHIGLLYMARAGYDPAEAVAFWERFAKFNEEAGGGGDLWFLRTHPLDAKRIADLKALLPRARAEYEKTLATQKPAGGGQ
ncbi:MAG: M48 family metallopeptidase [Verrucomicrobiales bacterium]|nr:M48 family metallopeptidase [Verrucomicrobiales bacterium]